MEIAEDKLLAYQVAPALELVRILSIRRVAVDMSDTGLGKSYIALAVAKALNLRVLVVCPKAVRPVWKRVAEHFGLADRVHVETYDLLRRGKTRWFTKSSYLSRGKLKHSFDFAAGSANDLVVFDEGHYCAGRGTQNSELLIACRRQGVRTLLLSATLAENPLQLRAIGYALGLHSLTDFWDWARKQGVVLTPTMGPQWWASNDEKTAFMSRIGREILPAKGIRMEKAKLAHLFPTNIVTADVYDMPEMKEIKKVYAEMEKELGAVKTSRAQDEAAESKRLEEFERAHERWEALPELKREVTPEPEYRTAKTAIEGTRFRQEIELLKVPTFLQLAADAVAEGNRVALFVNFDATIEALIARADGIAIVRGGQSEEVRQHAIDEFNANRTSLIVLNAAAGGVGISLHDTQGGAPRVALISPMYSARNLTQVLGRCPRAGGKTPVVQKIIYAAGTIEEEACAAVRNKLTCLQSLNDGDLSAGLPFQL